MFECVVSIFSFNMIMGLSLSVYPSLSVGTSILSASAPSAAQLPDRPAPERAPRLTHCQPIVQLPTSWLACVVSTLLSKNETPFSVFECRSWKTLHLVLVRLSDRTVNDRTEQDKTDKSSKTGKTYKNRQSPICRTSS